MNKKINNNIYLVLKFPAAIVLLIPVDWKNICTNNTIKTKAHSDTMHKQIVDDSMSLNMNFKFTYNVL